MSDLETGVEHDEVADQAAPTGGDAADGPDLDDVRYVAGGDHALEGIKGQELAGESLPAPTNSEFMRLLLQPARNGTFGWVAGFIGNPNSGEASWMGRPYRGGGEMEREVDSWGRMNAYFSTAALVAGPGGDVARKKSNFSQLLALVVDDADPDQLQGTPSWILETSPGKVQVGIFLDGVDDSRDHALIDELMQRLYEHKLIGGDRSGNNAVRYVRLPVGTNGKPRQSGPYKHVVERWKPNQRVRLADAAAMLGVDLDTLRDAAKAKASNGLGPMMPQGEKLAMLAQNIVSGSDFHNSVNAMAASLVATGLHPGAATNLLRGLMHGSLAPRDERWLERFDDIPRSVLTAVEKFVPPPPLSADVEAEVEPQPVLVRASELMKNMDPTEWLIDGYLEDGAMSMVYGPPSSGKSFITIDQACCVAKGIPWHNCVTKKGPVVIVAGEGHGGLKRRLAAWCVANMTNLDDAELYLTKAATPFLDIGAAMVLVDAIDAVCRSLDKPPVLVIVDTVARNFGPGDENSAKDVTQFIATLDRLVKNRYGCHVILVHHSGLEGGRARGSTAFKGAVDQEFEVKAYGTNIQYTNKKMKDGPTPAEKRFDIEGDIFICDSDKGPVYGAALKLSSDPLDLGMINRKGKPAVTLRDMLQFAYKERWVNYEKQMEQLGVGKKEYLSDAWRKAAELGWAEKDPTWKGNGAPYVLTEKARQELRMSGADIVDQVGRRVGVNPLEGD